LNKLRSALFNVLLYGGSLFWSIALLWSLLLPTRICLKIVYNLYIRYINLIEKYVMGITLVIEGMENIPSHGKFIIAAKHQSAFETLNIPFMKEFHYPAIVLKQELTRLPVWGMYPKAMGQIAIDRGSGTVAMRSIVNGAKRSIDNDRPVIIFPQGTRTAIGDKSEPYRSGIAKIHKEVNVPIIPLALNSGLVWPKNSFTKYPGVVTYKFMPAIEGDIPTSELMEKLENIIETETDKLVAKEIERKKGK